MIWRYNGRRDVFSFIHPLSMALKKEQLPLLITLLVAVLVYTALFVSRQNYEFLIYVGVIVFFLILILSTLKRTQFSNFVLWGLIIWSILHMSGGGLMIGEGRLYEFMLIPLSDSYPIFRYDQFVHIFGFAVATLVSYELIRPLLKPGLRRWTALSIVLVMAGLGFGALNEIVEFLATVITPETGVGGYVNTSLDLVSNLIGAIIGLGVIRWRSSMTSSPD